MSEQNRAEKSGISPKARAAMTKRHKEIAEAIQYGQADVDDMVEHALLGKALAGDLKAQAFWLSNRMPELLDEERRNHPQLSKFGS